MSFNILQVFFKDESGATAIEYVFLTSLVAMAMILVLTKTTQSINNNFNVIISAMNTVN
ncbi:hypothetical protein B488_12900 [Liberibacter crescens BT-1]|uniref:Flp pilus assembly protein, pilin Flp n=1 Tax=Liberibacter crescens (strain BT-1) TaxID=1215343 RepID=L0EWE3_LIBCB|nr:Flp family type IVb pilin [Liberibacter crescens]AGA65282.1 hypothetical protein B488_12900 [Liberibacter crescens BT-1]AMC13213.1 pilus assembly protein [Liberibacter crescens]